MMTDAFNRICYSPRGGADCARMQKCVHEAMQLFPFAEDEAYSGEDEDAFNDDEDPSVEWYDPLDFRPHPAGDGLLELLDEAAPSSEAPGEAELDASAPSHSGEGGAAAALAVPAAAGAAAGVSLLLALGVARWALRRMRQHSRCSLRHPDTATARTPAREHRRGNHEAEHAAAASQLHMSK